MIASFNTSKEFSYQAKTFEISEERQQKLIDEVYYDDGGFFSFFTSKPKRQHLNTVHSGRPSDLVSQTQIQTINDIDQSEYFSINTNRNLENYKEEVKAKREKRMHES